MNALATGDWLSRERVLRIALISGGAGFAMLLFLWFARTGTLDTLGKPVGADFTAFWHAGGIANAGDPSRAWDQQLLNVTVAATHGVEYGTTWIYPPVFLLLAAPFASLPYLPAALLWQFSGLAVAGWTLLHILKSRRDTLIALCSPIVPLVLAHGQNSLFTAALLGGGLLVLNKRPKLGGTLLAMLVYKPQLGLVVGPLLLLTGKWRALAATALVASVLILLSILLWGFDSWLAFAASLDFGRQHIIEQSAVGVYKSASLFAMARRWGATIDLAYAAQALGAFYGLVLIWRTRLATPRIQAAATCVGAALSTPYLFDYDMVIVGVGAAFLYAEARTSAFLPHERSILAFIWIAPWFSRPAAEYLAVPLGPMAMLLLACAAWRRASPALAQCHAPDAAPPIGKKLSVTA